MPSPTNRVAGGTVTAADINALATVANGAETAAAAAVARANHTGTQAISTVTSLQTTLDAKETPAGAQSKADAAGLLARERANHTGVQPIISIEGLDGDLADATRGPVVYVRTGSSYVLAAGQLDDGVSPRFYLGGADGAPEAQVGHVAREGDVHFAVTA